MISTIEELRIACSTARNKLIGEYLMRAKTFEEIQDLADQAMIGTLMIEETLQKEHRRCA